MKRMNEVFELPVSADDKGVNDSNGIRFLGDFYCSKEKVEATAHAINHVDTLAGALADLLDAVVNRDSHDSINNQIIAAAISLGKYRGEK
jgi:hypothetical protein